MTWETLDDSTIDNAEEEKPKANFWQTEGEVPQNHSGRANIPENVV